MTSSALAVDAGQDAIGRRFDLNGGFIGDDDEERISLVDVARLPCFSHSTKVPVSMTISTLGMMTSVAMSTFLPAPARAPPRQYLRPGARPPVRGSGCRESGHPARPGGEWGHRDSQTLRSPAITAASSPPKPPVTGRFVRDQHPAGLGHRADDRLRIEGLQAARIDHFDLNAFGGQLFGRFQRARHHDRVGHDRQVTAFALDLRRLQRECYTILPAPGPSSGRAACAP